MNLQDAYKQFVRWGASKYSPRTLYTYRILVNRFVEYAKPETLVKAITLDEINDYYTYLKHLRLADSTIAYHMIALRQYWYMLFMNGKTKLSYQLINVPKYSQVSYPACSQAIAQKLISKVWGEDVKAIRDRLIISLLTDSGMRVAELCDLKVKELRIADRYAVITSKKNRRIRRIFWTERTEVYLAQYLGYWRAITKGDHLIISLSREGSFGEKLTTRSVERLFNYYGKLAGAEWVTPHTLRHGVGEDLAKQNRHPRHIQLLLGHLHITGSETYLDVNDQELIKVYREFAKDRLA